MTIEEMKKRKRELGLSNQDLARLSGVPLGTLQKIFSGATVNPRRAAVAGLERALSAREAGVRHGRKQGEYTRRDYDALPADRRAELIDGAIYDMAAPSSIHQELTLAIAMQLKEHVNRTRGVCRVNIAPFDVQLDEDERTMVQPDISVICDRGRLRSFGCFGAPDLIVEVLSPASSRMDISLKLQKYVAAGVKEYWMVDPKAELVTVVINSADAAGFRHYSFSDRVPVGIWDGSCQVDFGAIREDIAFLYELDP